MAYSMLKLNRDILWKLFGSAKARMPKLRNIVIMNFTLSVEANTSKINAHVRQQLIFDAESLWHKSN